MHILDKYTLKMYNIKMNNNAEVMSAKSAAV